MSLRLLVTDFEDEAQWRWLLTDEHGAFLADHAVGLDRDAPEFQGWIDPYAHVRWHADPASGLDGARALVDELGQWIGVHVWGDVGERIAERAKESSVVVRVSVPASAEAMLYRPLELGYLGGLPLAQRDISLVFEFADATGSAKADVGERLRMLALFSVPTDQTALNSRHERYELRRLVHRTAQTAARAIELRVLQYGVTQELFASVLAEGGGWDLIHFSGHGLPAGLVLEHPDGTADVVTSDKLSKLLWPIRAQLKLVTLSSCESAAATVAETMRLLGLPVSADVPAADETDERPLPALAHKLAGDLGCAVLAMRYPVDDDFAVELAGHLYEGLFEKGQPLTRALQMALVHPSLEDNRDRVPPLSVATPALFGAAAADLSLQPPPSAPGTSAIVDLSSVGLSHFPPEPRLFVGRVGALARARASLAPTSPHRAIVFYGMAGAGKTACALELAYCHQEGRFQAMAWYSAPPDGQDISGTLAAFAVALESQVAGLDITPVIDDLETLERFLPRLTAALANSAVLIVLDNVESLLTERGAWRDPRWKLLIEAIVGHEGLSRLVITSRHIPEGLATDQRVGVEQIDTLSAGEAVLLARQLPNLGRLIRADGIADASGSRELARRALETVQGNPKLIELADRQAADPQGLRERLDDAAAAWGADASRLSVFFATGRPDHDYDARDFLRVLETWTTGAARRLPRDARIAFQLVCALEERDRFSVVVDGNWADLWHRLDLPEPAPDPHHALRVVASQGLIDMQADGEDHVLYHVHPAVEHASRQSAEAGFQTAVDTELALYWETVFAQGLQNEEHDQGGLIVVYSGLAATPYLLRLDRPAAAIPLLERVLSREDSPHLFAAMLPTLEQIIEHTAGTPAEISANALLLRIRGMQAPVDAVAPMRELLDRAVEAEDWVRASGLAGEVVALLLRANRFDEALELVEAKVDYTRRAGLGPWTQLTSESLRLAIHQGMGKNEQVLATFETLQRKMDAIGEEAADTKEMADRWRVREGIIGVAHRAALTLKRFDVALELNSELLSSKRERGTSALLQARTAFNDYGPLLYLKRYDDADRLLRWCRSVFETAQSRNDLIYLYGAWSDLEDERGHYDQAIAFVGRSMRLAYAVIDPSSIVNGHHNLANYVEHSRQDPERILANRLAAAVVAYAFKRADISDLLYGLRDVDRQALPSFQQLCDRMMTEQEVDLARLQAAFPPNTPSGEEILRNVLDLAYSQVPDHLNEERLLQNWRAIIDAVVAATKGDRAALSDVEPALESLSATQDWATLTAVLRRIATGERDREVLLEGLDPIDTIIVSATLDQLGRERRTSASKASPRASKSR